MKHQEQQHGLGILSVILLLIVPMAIWIAYNGQGAFAAFLIGLVVVAIESVEARS